MSNPENVPAPDLFNRFLLGTLPREERLEVERYLDNQPAAAETLRGLSPEADTFLIALQGAQAAPPSAPEVREIVESAKRQAAALGMTSLGDTNQAASRFETASGFSEAPPDFLSFLGPAEQPDEIGRLGGYRILRVLGMGGMGVVFEAEDPRLKRRVALKVVRPTIAQNQGVHDRFLREARAAAAIEHDHVVSIHQVGEDRGVPFLAMPLLQGESLDDRLRREKRLPVPDVLRIGREIAEGLAAAHDHGLIHRDIKPANIWLDRRTGRVKILDFGLARGTEQTDEPQLTLAGSIIGTPAYMAPEQAQGLSLCGRCDLFSLGCLLFRATTGEVPFPGSTPMQILSSLATHTPARVDGLVSDAPPALADVIARLLEKSPTDRPASAHEVVRLLQAIVAPTASIPIAKPVGLPNSATVTIAVRQPDVQTAGGPAPQAARRGNRPVVAALAILAVLGGLTWQFGAVIIRIATNSGELIVEIDQPGAEVEVRTMADAVEIHETGKTEPIKISVHPGKHKLQITKDGFKVFADEFELALGGQTKITAKLVPLSKKPVPTADEQRSPTLAMQDPAFEEWVRSVQALPAGVQIAKVVMKLQELNPAFDGQETHRVEDGKVTGFGFAGDNVTDISPVRALRDLASLALCWSKGVIGSRLSDLSPLRGMSLRDLDCLGTRVSDLTPLKGMPLTSLMLRSCPVSDLSPLTGTPLIVLDCYGTKISDLRPLNGMKLEQLELGQTAVTDLTPLKNMQLTRLNLEGCSKVSDLSPLKNMQLTSLHVGSCSKVSDLSPLKGMPLTILVVEATNVADLSPLEGMLLANLSVRRTKVTNLNVLKRLPLTHLLCDFKPNRDSEILRTITTLQEINFKPVADFWKEVESQQAAFETWTKRVAGMAPEEQVQAVAVKLKELNPEFDGKVVPTIENGVVSALQFVTDNVTDISPVRALADLKSLTCGGSSDPRSGRLEDLSPLKGMMLTSLDFGHTQVTNLSPLRGMPLTRLQCGSTLVADLWALKDMPLTHLWCGRTRINDLSPLTGMPLEVLDFIDTQVSDLKPLSEMRLKHLNFWLTGISDLSPLKNMALEYLKMSGTPVVDLTPLEGMPLTTLECGWMSISDLSPLEGMPLERLVLESTPVVDLRALRTLPQLRHLRISKCAKLADLSPLKGLPLTSLWFDFKPFHDAELLRSIKTLKEINQNPAEEFWKEFANQQAAFETWTKHVAGMAPEEQVQAVAVKLKELNPEFDGKVTPTISNNIVTSLEFLTEGVTDISPLRALSGLRKLNFGKGRLADLTPLTGMQLTEISCNETLVADLLPLKGMPLTHVSVGHTPVADLSPLAGMPITNLSARSSQLLDLWPLKGMPLTSLDLRDTPVDDLSPLAGMSLEALECTNTRVTDLSPLGGMPLFYVHFSFTPIDNLSALKGMPLKELGCIGTKVADLSPLAGTKLKALFCQQTPVVSLSPLAGMPLARLECESGLLRNSNNETLRSMKTLETVNGKAAAEFWQEVDLREGAFGSWMKRVARMPVEQQAEAVAAKLKELNPGFDGNVESVIEQGIVRHLVVRTDEVTDISPVRALPGLFTLSCCPNGEKQGKLADLSPLKGLRVSHLTVRQNPVSDISPLEGMSLMSLDVYGTQVVDLSPLSGMSKLDSVDCRGTRVADLSPLQGLKLSHFYCAATRVTDLSPLNEMPIVQLDVSFNDVVDLSPLAGMPMTSFDCRATKVTDLTPLAGMPLAELRCSETSVASLAPLKGMKLTLLVCSRPRDGDLSPIKDMPLSNFVGEVDLQRDGETLRSIKTLETINSKPAAEFWKEVK